MPKVRRDRRRVAKKPIPAKVTKPKIAPVNPQDILGRAMLANVRIRTWEARKHDREVTEEVNAQHKATPDAGRYHKHLFGGSVKELGELITAVQVLRRTHYAETLPWSDEGWRILTTANYTNYTEKMRAAVARFEGARDALLAVYEHWAFTEAPKRLGSMYRREDYPAVASVKDRYAVRVEYAPIPAATDFRVTLPDEQLASVKHDVEDRVLRAVTEAMQDVWGRLGEAVEKLKDRLVEEDGKNLREPVLKSVRATAEALGRLNLTNNAQLEETRRKVLALLDGYDAETLRGNDTTRNRIATEVNAILGSMAGLYGPPASA